MIVGTHSVLYQLQVKSSTKDNAHLNQMILHASLDVVDEIIWNTSAMALKVVDQFSGQLVSAYMTASKVKFVLLHPSRNEDGIKSFFQHVHELYIKVYPSIFKKMKFDRHY